MGDRYKVIEDGVGAALVISDDADICDSDVLEMFDELRDEYLYGEPE